jgi:hypothetical protein
VLQLTKSRFAAATDAAVLPPPDNCIVVISQIELDLATTQKALAQLLAGLEEMRPHIIVIMGDFVSQRISDKMPYEGFRQYFESISQIARDNSLTCLKEQTEWIFVPSVDDPGMTKMMPCMPLAEYFLTGPRSQIGNQRILKNVTMASNPFRMSYYGKEIVFSRYNYFKKLKKNHLAKVELAVQRIRGLGAEQKDDTLKVARTILHQGQLMPLSSVVQPVMWTFAKDCLNLVPHPDYLILADDCADYHHKLPVEDGSHVHVMNPGNFAIDRSFLVFYPKTEDIQPSHI